METDDGMAQCRRRAAMTPHTQSNENEEEKLPFEEQQLIPGILNEITLDRIAPKVPWKAFHVLSAVSRGWRQTIQCRGVYDSRVRASSTVTLVVHTHEHDREADRVALYSLRDKCCYELPPIPGVFSGFPVDCQCISLNGKLYVLGGELMENNRRILASKEVYVFDVMGQRQWKQCASMKHPRLKFACGVTDGKIYVFGGMDNRGLRQPVHGSEVYDPEVNAWSSIKPMPTLRLTYEVATLGKKIFVHGGKIIGPSLEGRQSKKDLSLLAAEYLEVYDPIEDEWISVRPTGLLRYERRSIFEAQGKLHSMSKCDIHVHDTNDGKWEHRHSNIYPAMGPTGRVKFLVLATFPVGAELCARAFWISSNDPFRVVGLCLLRSIGFGSNNKELFWEVVAECPGSFQCSGSFDCLCTIQF